MKKSNSPTSGGGRGGRGGSNSNAVDWINFFEVEDELRGPKLVENESRMRTWEATVRKYDKKLTEAWLWQYWRADNRASSQVSKVLFQGFDARLRAQKKVKDLIRQGVPSSFRSKIWWICSGGAEKMATAGPEMQYTILVSNLTLARGDMAILAIEKDANNTFLDNEFFGQQVAKDALYRVLAAYSLRNPSVSYGRSTNLVAALLLLYLSEEQAFWVLAALIEDILPRDFYSMPTMLGCRIDQQVFESCVAWKLPALARHFKKSGFITDPVSCHWFLSLFIHSLPLTVVARVFDCLLWEGNIVLLRVGLAMCKIQEEKLLAAKDVLSIYKLLRDPFNEELDESVDGGEGVVMDPNGPTLRNADHVIATAFDKKWLGSIPRSKIEALRKEFRKASEKAQLLRQTSGVRIAEKRRTSIDNCMKLDANIVPERRGSTRASMRRQASGSGKRASAAARASAHVAAPSSPKSIIVAKDEDANAGAVGGGGADSDKPIESNSPFSYTDTSAATASPGAGMIEDDGQAYVEYGDSDDEDTDDDDEFSGRGMTISAMRPSELTGAIEMLQQQRVDEFGSEDADEVLRRVLLLEDGTRGSGSGSESSVSSGSTGSISSKVGGFFRIGFSTSSSPSSSASPTTTAASGSSSSSVKGGSSADALDLDEDDEEEGDVCVDEDDD